MTIKINVWLTEEVQVEYEIKDTEFLNKEAKKELTDEALNHLEYMKEVFNKEKSKVEISTA